jgi:hypothetical protein
LDFNIQNLEHLSCIVHKMVEEKAKDAQTPKDQPTKASKDPKAKVEIEDLVEHFCYLCHTFVR